MADRLDVRKTYKLYIGGKFPRSESGRSYEIHGHDGALLANAVRASRKDVRDAVVAARTALPAWTGTTAYNRGQILYRVAEIMEGRRDQLRDEVARAEGGGGDDQVTDAIDTWVWYAGWTDKIAQVMGNLNPVAGPYFNITVPEPIGVVAIVAPERPSLRGLVDALAPALCAGNAVVVLASEAHPLPAITLSECLATSDVPAGVVNILTGHKSELVPILASHLDVDALDATGVDDGDMEEVRSVGAANVKRLVRGHDGRSPYAVTSLMEMKTVWHPKGT